MKLNFLNYALVRTALTACFLLWLNQCGICQNTTGNPAKSEAYSESFDLNAHIPEIVRDLKLCDQIKEERDVLTAYNSALKSDLSTQTTKRIAAEADRDKYKLKTKGRGRTIAVIISVVVIREGLQILIRR